jgi:acyl-CoA thioesterase FadM
MESAEAELFRQLGFPLLWSDTESSSGFPRVDSQCTFLRPLVFGELVRIELSISEMSPSTIHYKFRFFKENGRRCAEGKLVTTCATRLPSGKLAGQTMPDDLYQALLKWKKSTSDSSSSTN